MSSFHPDTVGLRWSLVQVRLFSRAAGKEGRCRQISLACVGSPHSVPSALGLSPAHGCVLSPFTLLRLLAALQGAGPVWLVLPVFGFSTKAQTRLGLRFVPSPPEQLRQPGAWRARSPRVQRAFSPPRSQPQFPPAPVGCVRLCLFVGAGL